MPRVSVDWLEGRTKEQRDQIAEKITEAFVSVLKIEPARISIAFREIPSGNLYRGGKP